MTREDDVIYRKGMSEAELLKARENTMEQHVKSHAGKGGFAGFMLFTIVSELIGASTLVVVISGALGAGFGAFLGHMEASAREKRLKGEYAKTRTGEPPKQ